MKYDNDDETAYEILRLKARIETNQGILEREGDLRRSDGKMVSERLRDLQAALADLEGNDEARQEAEDYNRDDLRDDGRSGGYGESYAERNA
jgi:hypothetical protein